METQRAELKDRLKEALDARNKKPADLSKDLKIPKSAISQYLSGKVKDMDTKRFYEISKWQCWNFNDSKGFHHLCVASVLPSENALNYRTNTNAI